MLTRALLASLLTFAASPAFAQTTAPDPEPPKAAIKADRLFPELAAFEAQHPNALWLTDASRLGELSIFAMESIPDLPPDRSLRFIAFSGPGGWFEVQTYKGGTSLHALLRPPPPQAFNVTANADQPTALERLTQVLSAATDLKDVVIIRTQTFPPTEALATVQAHIGKIGATLHVIESADREQVATRRPSVAAPGTDYQQLGAMRRSVIESGGKWISIPRPVLDDGRYFELLKKAHTLDAATGHFQLSSVYPSRRQISPPIVPVELTDDYSLQYAWAELSEIDCPDPVVQLTFAADDTVQSAKLVNTTEELTRLPADFQRILLNSAYTWKRIPPATDTITLTFLRPAKAP
ncbi:MAG TPA: hypothetical protein VK157_13360 [Phycisphaerales bacterium]|nr:hypothetical protein [Phycisphaerales bacterium]